MVQFRIKSILFINFFFCLGLLIFPFDTGIESGQRYKQLIIRGVMLQDGNGTPVKGPVDITLEGNTISAVHAARPDAAYQEKAHVIDGTGLTCLPGLINVHAHIHDSRNGDPIPFEYLYKLWLSCGITTVRDVGSNINKTIAEREKSRGAEITAPRIFLYMRAGGRTPEEARASVRRVQEAGADGIKIFGMDRDIMQAVTDEAHKLGLRISHHVGVEETDAWEDAEFGVTSVEHWYGIPDAALHGSQNFPSWYNYNNENDRFRYAGRLWREADPDVLVQVLQTMVETGVAWCPTFVIYEANRDLQRAKNQPWFKDYLHPVLEEYFIPDPAKHGSYFWKWTTEDEIFWKENYNIWMDAVSRFADMGGIVGCGEDAGYIYMMYGFSLIRELELHQEAGFHPIDVIQHATYNNACILGQEDKLGRVRNGYLADLILVKGNPQENMKYLYPTGLMEMKNGRLEKTGGVEWTIKDGIVYHAPSLLQEVKEMVAEARKNKE
jgi:cytosine/adenosine deaminase-related metal-dependent hydrolase